MVKLNKDKQEIRHTPFALLSITAAGNQQKKEFSCKHYILHRLVKRGPQIFYSSKNLQTSNSFWVRLFASWKE